MTKYPPVSYCEVALLLAQGVGPEEIARTMPCSLHNLRQAMCLFNLRRAKPYRKLASVHPIGQAVGNTHVTQLLSAQDQLTVLEEMQATRRAA